MRFKKNSSYESKLSLEFARLRDLCRGSDITLGELFENMTSRSHALLTLIFALPFLLPIPLPGLSIIFGLVIMLAGGAMGIGRKPWLPQFFLKRSISTQTLSKIFEQGARFTRILEKVIRPRGTHFLRHIWVKRFNGFLIAICGLLLALPLPPGTNFPPASVILLLSIGSLEEDVLVILLGYGAFVVNLVFFGSVAKLGANGIKMLFPS